VKSGVSVKVEHSAEAPEELPIAFSATLDRIRVRWVTVSDGEPRTVCHWLHLLFIALRDRDPPAVYGLGTPDQGTGQEPTSGDQFQHL
jgi:hypothetical protein